MHGCLSITLPFFLLTFLKNFLIAGLITAVIGIGCIVFPPLILIAGVWAVVNVILRIARILRNLFPMMAGFGLYAILLVGPHAIASVTMAGFLPMTMTTIVAASAGTAVICFALACFERLGYSRKLAGCVMLGFPAYLAILVVTMLFPFGDGSLDDGGYETHGE